MLGLLLRRRSETHFPPTEEGVLAWSSCFGAGRSFKIDVAHLEKACLLLGVGASWKSKSVTIAGHGLSKAGGRSFPQGRRTRDPSYVSR